MSTKQQEDRPQIIKLQKIVSFYRFTPLEDPSLIKEEILSFSNIKGLVILALEGLNGTVSAEEKELEKFINYLESKFPKGDWRYKFSESEFLPFKRLAVKIREEIVTSGYNDLVPFSDLPEDHPERYRHLTAEQWHNELSSSNPPKMIDVRNSYEYNVGHFEGAIDPSTNTFKNFPDFLANSTIEKDEKVLIYCTGGIRCEKAILEMEQLGYNNVYQLDGGILRYMETFPQGKFKGECFVFDDRVALDKDLKPTTSFSLCPHCGDPAREKIECLRCQSPKQICEKCFEIEHKRTCSKNCSYHYQRNSKNKVLAKTAKKNQKKNTGVNLILFFCFFISSYFSEVKAAETPSAVVTRALHSIKEEGNPSPIVDFVDWKGIFLKLPKNSKQLMKVDNEKELKEYYRELLKSPSAAMSKLLDKKFEEITSEEMKEKGDKILSKFKEKLKRKEDKIKEKLNETEYTVISEKIDGSSAIVTVRNSYKNAIKEDKIPLVKREDTWFISDIGKGFSGL